MQSGQCHCGEPMEVTGSVVIYGIEYDILRCTICDYSTSEENYEL